MTTKLEPSPTIRMASLKHQPEPMEISGRRGGGGMCTRIEIQAKWSQKGER